MKLQWHLAIAFVLGSLGLSTTASATLLFSGGEDVDFICAGTGSCNVDTSARHRAGWSRESISLLGSNASDPPSNRIVTPPFATNSTIWVHGQFCANNCSGSDNTSGAQLLRVIDTLGNPTLIVRGTGTLGQFKISSRTAAGAFTDLVTCPAAVTIQITQLDLRVTYGTSGEVTLFSNSVQVCDFTGNVTNGDGATTLNQVELSSAGGTSYWSEVIIATTDTRAMARFTANTVANGNTTGFSGSNICSAIWSATAFNDTSFGFSGSNNVLHQCTINSSIPPGVYSVLGLGMSARVLVGSSGPAHFDFVTRVNGTDFPSPDFSPTQTFSNIANYIQATNPSTGNPWSIADFQATGFNVGEETKP
jgi:hypothetical protein